MNRHSGLRRRAVVALFWSALRTTLLSLASPALTLILTRWLSPADFGLVGLATILLTLGGLLQTAGLTSALIRLPVAEAQAVAPALFWIILGLSGLLYAGVWAAAPGLAALYANPELTWVLRVSAWRLPLGALTAVPLALAQREFGFRPLAGAQLAATLVPIAVALPLALAGWGYRALVWGGLAGAGAHTLVLWWRSDWRPSAPEWTRVRPLARFGLWVTVENLEAWALTQADNALLSLRQGMAALGLYSTGFNLAFLGAGLLAGPVQPVAYSAFSQLASDLPALRSSYLQLNRFLAAVTWPLGVGLALLARPAITLWLGPAWQPMALVVEVFGLYGAWAQLWALNAEIGRALNQPQHQPRIYALLLGYMLPACWWSAAYGLAVFTLVRGAMVVLAAAMQLTLSRRLLDLHWRDWWGIVRAPLAGCLGMAAGMAVLQGWPPSGLLLASSVMVGGGLYMGLLLSLDRMLVGDLWRLLGDVREPGVHA